VAEPAGRKPREQSSGGGILQIVGTVVGLLAFFLGVQSFGDLKQRLFPQVVASTTPSIAPEPEASTTPDRDLVKWRYVQDADAACARASKGTPGKIDTITYDWMTRVLTARERFYQAWTAVPWPAGEPDPVHEAELRKIWADFAAGTAAWREMRNDLKAHDGTEYNLDLEDFVNARNSFIDGANRFGFRSCNYGFPTTSAWT
jgi:hypothetical protein